MFTYGPITLVGGQASVVRVNPSPDTIGVCVYNESPYFLQVSLDSSVSFPLAAFTADAQLAGGGFSGNITINPLSYLTTQGQAPANVVFVQTFGRNDNIAKLMLSGAPTGYPLNLQRLSSIGNNLNLGTSATSIVNDNNPLGTSLIEATPTGAGGSTWIADNTGNFTVKEDVAGVLTALLQVIVGTGLKLGSLSPARIVEIIGNMQVDGGKINDSGGTLRVDFSTSDTTINAKDASHAIHLQAGGSDIFFANTGSTLMASGKLGANASGDWIDASGVNAFYKAPGGGNIQFQIPNGTTVVTITGSTLQLASGVGLTWKTGDTISGTHTFTGTTTGTYTHGAGGTPFIVIPMCDVVGSQTMGYDTVTSTQVHITSGGGLGFKALCLLG
jgi:hypothetical protein